MLLRLVGGRRAVGAFALCLRAGEGTNCRAFHPADKPEAPTARTPSTGCARAERHLRTKNHARVFRDLT
jgi:hypothetical protein